MISDLPLGRGNVDAMGEDRPKFRFNTLRPGEWVGHLVDSHGRVGVENSRLVSLTSSREGEPYLLGRTGDGLVHVAWIDEGDAAGDSLQPLTAVAADLSADDSMLASRAVALARWHGSFIYCPRCGSRVEIIDAGWATSCGGCGAVEYPRMDPVVIMRVIDSLGRILLASNATWAPGRMSLPAGYVEAGETPPQAVQRELWEEVKVKVENIDYLASQSWPGPRSMMLAFAATVTGGTVDPVPDQVEVTSARFFSKQELVSAFSEGSVVGPGPSSIAFAVINDWLDQD